MQYIFPGAKINTELIDSNDFTIVIANLFKNESPIGLEKRLIQDYKLPDSPESGKLASKVAFLISLFDFTPEEVMGFYKEKQRTAIDDSTILEWIEVTTSLSSFGRNEKGDTIYSFSIKKSSSYW